MTAVSPTSFQRPINGLVQPSEQSDNTAHLPGTYELSPVDKAARVPLVAKKQVKTTFARAYPTSSRLIAPEKLVLAQYCHCGWGSVFYPQITEHSKTLQV